MSPHNRATTSNSVGHTKADVERCVRQLPLALQSATPCTLVDHLATVFLPADLGKTVRLNSSKFHRQPAGHSLKAKPEVNGQKGAGAIVVGTAYGGGADVKPVVLPELHDKGCTKPELAQLSSCKEAWAEVDRIHADSFPFLQLAPAPWLLDALSAAPSAAATVLSRCRLCARAVLPPFLAAHEAQCKAPQLKAAAAGVGRFLLATPGSRGGTPSGPSTAANSCDDTADACSSDDEVPLRGGGKKRSRSASVKRGRGRPPLAARPRSSPQPGVRGGGRPGALPASLLGLRQSGAGPAAVDPPCARGSGSDAVLASQEGVLDAPVEARVRWPVASKRRRSARSRAAGSVIAGSPASDGSQPAAQPATTPADGLSHAAKHSPVAGGGHKSGVPGSFVPRNGVCGAGHTPKAHPHPAATVPATADPRWSSWSGTPVGALPPPRAPISGQLQAASPVPATASLLSGSPCQSPNPPNQSPPHAHPRAAAASPGLDPTRPVAAPTPNAAQTADSPARPAPASAAANPEERSSKLTRNELLQLLARFKTLAKLPANAQLDDSMKQKFTLFVHNAHRQRKLARAAAAAAGGGAARPPQPLAAPAVAPQPQGAVTRGVAAGVAPPGGGAQEARTASGEQERGDAGRSGLGPQVGRLPGAPQGLRVHAPSGAQQAAVCHGAGGRERPRDVATPAASSAPSQPLPGWSNGPACAPGGGVDFSLQNQRMRQQQEQLQHAHSSPRFAASGGGRAGGSPRADSPPSAACAKLDGGAGADPQLVAAPASRPSWSSTPSQQSASENNVLMHAALRSHVLQAAAAPAAAALRAPPPDLLPDFGISPPAAAPVQPNNSMLLAAMRTHALPQQQLAVPTPSMGWCLTAGHAAAAQPQSPRVEPQLAAPNGVAQGAGQQWPGVFFGGASIPGAGVPQHAFALPHGSAAVGAGPASAPGMLYQRRVQHGQPQAQNPHGMQSTQAAFLTLPYAFSAARPAQQHQPQQPSATQAFPGPATVAVPSASAAHASNGWARPLQATQQAQGPQAAWMLSGQGCAVVQPSLASHNGSVVGGFTFALPNGIAAHRQLVPAGFLDGNAQAGLASAPAPQPGLCSGRSLAAYVGNRVQPTVTCAGQAGVYPQ